MISFLAAIQQAPSAPGATPAPAGTSASPQDLIRDIAPPVAIPMPWWQFALIIGGAILLIAAVIWGVRRLQSRNSTAPPPTPRAVAIRDLEKLRPQVRTLDPYPFSIAVSDVLRSFVGAQFGLRAREQTSQEFLATLANAPGFTGDDRRLLADFLEKCDLIKFARIQAEQQVNEDLLSSAAAFVHGGRA